ncbi:unnamed protein product [Cochlearia groenlandica]
MNSRSLPSLFGPSVPTSATNPDVDTTSEPRARRSRDLSGGNQTIPRIKRARTDRPTAEVGSHLEVRGGVPAGGPDAAVTGTNLPPEGVHTEGRPGDDVVEGGGVGVSPAVIGEVVGAIPTGDEQQVERTVPLVPSEGDSDVFTSSSLPLFKGGDFSFQLGKEKGYGFEFVYGGEGPFLNNGEACAGFEHLLFESHEDKCPPNSLIFEDEIAALARLEQRVS